jgi:hypothetical protein
MPLFLPPLLMNWFQQSRHAWSLLMAASVEQDLQFPCGYVFRQCRQASQSH